METAREARTAPPIACSQLTETVIREHESSVGALKRFTRKIQEDGILSEARRRQLYESPSVERERKATSRERKAAARGY